MVNVGISTQGLVSPLTQRQERPPQRPVPLRQEYRNFSAFLKVLLGEFYLQSHGV